MNLVYCLYGLDQKRIIKKRNEIIKEKDIDDFNISIFDMESTDISLPISDAKSIPFLTDYRAVVMKNCNFLCPQSKNKKKDDSVEKDSNSKNNKKEIFDTNLIIDYLNNPSKTTILIMEFNSEKLEGKSEIIKLIKEKKYALEIKPLTREEIAVEVVKFFKENQLVYKTEVKEEIVNRISVDPMSCDKELEKLGLYYIKGDKVTLDIVQKLITKSTDETTFQLMNAIMEKDKKKALNTYYDLIAQGNEPKMIQGFIIKRFSQILYAKEIIYSGGNKNDLAETLKISPGQAYYLMNDANKISYKKITRIINDLKELDYASKISYKYGSDETIGFELFLTKI